MRKNFLIPIILIVAIIIISIVVLYEPQDEKIKIGILTHQTGFGAIWGEPELKAVLLRVDELNNKGANIETVVEDCQSRISICVTAAIKLINVDKVNAIIGPTWDEWYEPVAQIAEDNKIILISPSGISNNDIGPYTFSLKQPNEDLAVVTLSFLEQNNVTDVALVTTQNAHFLSISNFINLHAPEYNINIKEHQVSPEEQSFQSVITKIKNDNSQAIISNLVQTQEPSFIKQLKELDFKGMIISTAGSVFVFDPDFRNVFKGAYYVDYLITPEFASYYSSKYDSELSPSAQMAYDAVSLIYDAAKRTNSNPEKMAEYLSNLQNFPGFSWGISFDEKGHGIFTLEVYEIKIFE